MLYKILAEAYERIEALSGRLEMTDELINTLSGLDHEELEASIRLSQANMFPGYFGLDLGIGEKMVLKALNQVTSITDSDAEELLKDQGDIGKTAEILSYKRKQMPLFNEPLTVMRVYNNMLKIAMMEGRYSQDIKVKLIAEMMHDASALESRYIARTACQKMRIGISDMTLIDALAYINYEDIIFDPDPLLSDSYADDLKKAISQVPTGKIAPLNKTIELLKKEMKNGSDKESAKRAYDYFTKKKELISSLRSSILRTYNIHPDLAYISKIMKRDGPRALNDVMVESGTPIMSMLGERLHSMEEILEKFGGRCALEYKYDGLRLQAHVTWKDGNKQSRLFSRQLEDVTDQFPEICEALSSRAEYECIVDGECVPVDGVTGELLPFQMISQRRGRKFELDRMMDEIPVKLVIFDCMFFNGEDTTYSPFPERRARITRIFPGIKEDILPDEILSLSRMEIVKDLHDANSFFDRSLHDGCEGIMAKSISDNSIYQAGGRGFLWIKYKREYMKDVIDTIDLVIIGGFKGSGKRAGHIGAYLGAVYNPEKDIFETLCKIGSGFKDDDLIKLDEMVKPLIRKEWDEAIPVHSRIIPDVIIEPKMVIEVIGAEISFSPVHTCGISYLSNGSGMALRFPRFTGRYRGDKSPIQATTSSEILRMYEEQVKSMRT